MAGGCGKVLGVGALVLVGLYLFGSHEDAKESRQAEQRLAEAVPVKVTAEQLWNEFQANEIAVEQRYKGQVLEVTGVITLITTDISGKPTVALQGGGRYDSVNVYFRETEMGKVAGVVKGQAITARCDKFAVALNTPLVRDCLLVS